MTSTVKKRKTKYPFVLKDLDIEEICKKYGYSYNKDICNITKLMPKNNNVTKLDEIIIESELEFTYLDETKNKRKIIVTMMDYNNHEAIKRCKCFWCKHNFDSQPIGCPVRYVPNMIVKKYFSHITKDYYTIKEEISNEKFELIHKDLISDKMSENVFIQLIKNDFYETDGVFCSFNCCLSWIKDNSHNNLYINSVYLLHQIYYDFFDIQHQIHPAPHWRMLKDYGGNLTIEDFRTSFNKVIYDNEHFIRSFPKTKPIGKVFEEFLKI